MGSASKQKGANFERQVCKQLSLWVSDGERSDLFWRSAMSGGRATVSFNRGDTDQQGGGDITAVDAGGYNLTSRFSIECKSYKDLLLQNLIYGRKGGLPEFWKQCVRDAVRVNKEPLLIAKQNQYPELICFTPIGKSIFELGNDHICGVFPRRHMYMMTFFDFLKYAVPPRTAE